MGLSAETSAASSAEGAMKSVENPTCPDHTPAPAPAVATPGGDESGSPRRKTVGLILDLVRPYRGWLAIVLGAMLVETAMSLAAPWPLKVVIDSVVGGHKLPTWLGWLRDFS